MNWSGVFETAVFSPHSLAQMERRGISEDEALAILRAPEQVIQEAEDRVVAQSRISIGEVVYLYRVFVAAYKVPPVVITAYRTSNVEKYWSPE